MALISPGVEVTVIDESQYIPSAVNTVPYFLVATAQNKVSSDGITVAAGTLAANANKTYLITSQRDLAATFGVPFFYNTTTGTPINGYELNEYGLLAAYSALGVTNRAYVQRVNIDLTELTASLNRPTGSPDNGDYWTDTSLTTWGIFEWNQTTSTFTNNVPFVLTDSADVEGGSGADPSADGTPLGSIGSIGDYAVTIQNQYIFGYYKRYDNTWALIGSNDWKTAWPTIVSANAPTSLTTGNNMFINGTLVTVGTGTVSAFSTVINNAAITGVTSRVVSGKLYLYADSTAGNDGSTLSSNGIINIAPGPTGGANLFTALGLTDATYAAPDYFPGYSYQSPRWRTTDVEGGRPTGSVWQNLSTANNGLDVSVKKYSTALGTFIAQSCPAYLNDANANLALDPSGGGKNIPVGSTYIRYNSTQYLSTPLETFSMEIVERFALGTTEVTGTTVVSTGTPFAVSSSFSILGTIAGEPGTVLNTGTATIGGTGTAADFITAVSAANVPFVSANINSAGNIVFTHSQGGSIVLANISGTPITVAGFTITTPKVRYSSTSTSSLILSNWVTEPLFTYSASDNAPSQDPANGRLWYYSSVTDADILIQDNGSWQGYQNVTNDVRGFDLSLTNATGPIIAASEPTTQTDTAESPLEYGDLWIDTSDLENYPKLYRWQQVSGQDQWVEVDTTDQVTENGILFADARWAGNGTTDPVADPEPTIESLLTSNYLDLDAPDPGLYPEGMLLFNTRRSGFNVKSFQVDYFNATTFSVDSYSNGTTYSINDLVLYEGIIYIAIAAGQAHLPTDTAFWSPLETNAWVTASGNRADGSPYMGRQSQRQIIVAALKSAIDTSDTLREEQNDFNLIACPQYPELITNMVALNNERNNTAFIVGDTPLRLGPSGTEIVSWATDNGGLGFPTADGLTISDPYVGVFYPSCQTTDLTGSVVVQPPSHMMLRTIVRSDEVSFPWLAPAGVRRGVIDNAATIGYVNAQTGEFVQIATGQGLRDVLYTNKINPITFIPGVGITNYGNKTESAVTSALDRINVARLIAYIRARLATIGKAFVFEPNDQITRNQFSNAVNSLMVDLVAKRGIYDYLVVCDLSNNTPARIDRNELYMDIAIEPVKAVEFIYIPVRIKNTGEIAAGQVATSATV